LGRSDSSKLKSVAGVGEGTGSVSVAALLFYVVVQIGHEIFEVFNWRVIFAIQKIGEGGS
jgi:hypothetical protein